MTAPDKRIVDFIKKHNVLTLATVKDNAPWCANCFYALLPETMQLTFMSDEKTRHSTEGIQNPKVAGSIVLESRIVGNLKGLQFTGALKQAENETLEQAKKAFFKRFPYAVAHPSTFWVIDLSVMKFTDNTLGFGKKLLWERE